VLRDLRLRPDEVSQEELDLDMREWRKRVVCWLGDASAALGSAPGTAPQAAKKYFRLPSQDLMVGLDMALRQCLGGHCDLKNFVMPGVPREPGEGGDYDFELAEMGTPGKRHNTLIMSIDQGSTGFCASWFMQYRLGIHLVVLPDIYHRCWNDLKMAIIKTGWHSHIVETTFLLNSLHAPWGTCRWFKELQEAALDYHKSTTHLDPLWQAFALPMLNDTGEAEDICDETIMLRKHAELPSLGVFSKRGEKVSASRWFQWLPCSATLDEMWHARLVVQIYIGLQRGWLQKDCASIGKIKVFRPADDMEPPKAGTGTQHSDEVKKLMARCQNTLHASTVLLLEPKVQRKSRLIMQFAWPLFKWHSASCEAVRSTSACMDFYSAEAAGASMGALSDIAGRLLDPRSLAYIGLEVGSSGAKLTPEDIADQDLWARAAVRFVILLLRFRLKGLLWLTRGWPGQFAKLNHADGEVVSDTLHRMRVAYSSWVAARKLPRPPAVLAKLLRRSVFQQPAVVNTMRLARDAGWQMSPDLRAAMFGMWSGIGHTKVVEDGFHYCRDLEQKLQANTRTAPMAMWHTLHQNRVLSAVHKYQEVDLSSAPFPKGSADAMPSDMHNARLKDRSIEAMDQLAGYTPATPWPTFSPASYQQLFSDQACLEYAHAEGGWEKIQNLWMGALFYEGLVVKHRSWDAWCISLGAMGLATGLGWPVDLQLCRGDGYIVSLRPRVQENDLKWLIMLDLQEWEALNVTWHSPAGLVGQGSPANGIKGHAAHKPESIMRVASRNAFWNLQTPCLKAFCRHLGLQVSGEGLVPHLAALIEYHLGPSEDEMVTILEQRMQLDADELSTAELVPEEVIMEAMPQEDKKEIESMQKEREVAVQTRTLYAKELRAYKARRQTNQGGQVKQGRGRPKASSASSSKPGVRKPTVVPMKDVDLHWVALHLPPGAKIRKCSFHSRYQCFFKGLSMSRSVRLHSDHGALLQLLNWAWQQAQLYDDVQCHLEGLGDAIKDALG